jgi:FAD/FMN-containing dehydrogenase
MMKPLPWSSWGLYPEATSQTIVTPEWQSDKLPSTKNLLPRGLGRSYGDVCLNEGGTLLSTNTFTHLISFNEQTGVLRAESGISFADILSFAIPRGWFLPVTPGTKYVTLGGAIANDLHGKNHHGAGTIGCHVPCFELLRSSGERLHCSSAKNNELFRATIGGLGLTGLITWAELQLIPIKNAFIDQEALPFQSLDEFFAINDDSDQKFTYTVAWIDTTLKNGALRGIFFRGNHASEPLELPEKISNHQLLSIPTFAPSSLLNPVSMKLFNASYFALNRLHQGRHLTHYDPFFYPLDKVGHWNRLYGRPGFLQYQFVVPRNAASEVVPALLKEAHRTNTVAFLSVLKTFGERVSPGILSFPRPGITLAMDVRNRGKITLETLHRFDEIVLAHQGRLYPAKDSRMSPQTFRSCYPELQEFTPHLDPAFSSQFWRRVMSS